MPPLWRAANAACDEGRQFAKTAFAVHIRWLVRALLGRARQPGDVLRGGRTADEQEDADRRRAIWDGNRHRRQLPHNPPRSAPPEDLVPERSSLAPCSYAQRRHSADLLIRALLPIRASFSLRRWPDVGFFISNRRHCFTRLDASVQGWINHVRCGDTRGLPQAMLRHVKVQ